MAVDYEKLKVGDNVRYLGGDSSEQHGGLIIGNVYDIVEKDSDGYIFFIDDDGDFRLLLGHNAHCFELVEDEGECNCDTIEVEAKDGVLSETICKYACRHDSHIVSLAKEVAQLKRELSDLMDAMQSQAYEDNERIERILDDIVMLDERTQDAGITEPTPVRKVVYEYERYYE